jgi:hypothetical protein
VLVDYRASMTSEGDAESRKNSNINAVLSEWLAFDGKDIFPAPQRRGSPAVNATLNTQYRTTSDMELRDQMSFRIVNSNGSLDATFDGDGGRFGREDDELLRPAALASGLEGPFPADTVFVRAMRGEFDAVIAPYHDVGMTAIKVASFGSAVNVTLGLRFPRTSPDHGTALDIAGQGIADPSSMIEAILLCARIVKRSQSSANTLSS